MNKAQIQPPEWKLENDFTPYLKSEQEFKF